MLQEGDPAPDFSLPADGGQRVALSALKGAPVVVYFYPKDDTSGCTKEAVTFSGLAEAFSALGARVVGVSPDTPASHDAFKARHGLKIALAADPDKEVARSYGVWVEKSMYGRKYMGVERATFLIDSNGRIAQIWRKVRVPGHAEAVLEAVGRLQ